jgi:hypothetical protein
VSSEAFTVLDEDRSTTVRADIHAGRVYLPAESLREALGWELKAEGLCKGDACIPLRDGGVVIDRGTDLGRLAELLGRPLALDLDERVARLGTSAHRRRMQLRSLLAPDFTLPDLAGRQHSLSALCGKKVLLVAYASW